MQALLEQQKLVLAKDATDEEEAAAASALVWKEKRQGKPDNVLAFNILLEKIPNMLLTEQTPEGQSLCRKILKFAPPPPGICKVKIVTLLPGLEGRKAFARALQNWIDTQTVEHKGVCET